MSLPLLTTNVTEVVITPFLELSLQPSGSPGWGLVTNNNLIKLENFTQTQSETITALQQTVDNALSSLNASFTLLQSDVQDEAIDRSNQDANLQSQIDAIPDNLSLTTRFVNRALTANSPATLVHNLGLFPAVTIIRQIGVSGGTDVTHYFDTVIQHNGPNQIIVTVGVGGVYTIICNT
jgi:hypothetical protein